MGGDKYRQAKKALCRALDQLGTRFGHMFNVCVFDHRQRFFSDVLIKANKNNLQNCKIWLKSFGPAKRERIDVDGPSNDHFELIMNMFEDKEINLKEPDFEEVSTGGTNVLEAMKAALKQTASADGQSFVVFLTDGLVNQGHAILTNPKLLKSKTRFLNFGIGENCNWWLLKQLADMSNGFLVTCSAADDVEGKMDLLLEKQDSWIVKDFNFGRVEAQDCLPDSVALPIGSVVAFHVRYKASEAPKFAEVFCMDPMGHESTARCAIQTKNDLPVAKYYQKAQKDVAVTKECVLELHVQEQHAMYPVPEHPNPSEQPSNITQVYSDTPYQTELVTNQELCMHDA